jgi:transcriptional regulator with XRE-family HTH domain
MKKKHQNLILLGRQIRNIRIDQGYSQKHFAEKIKIDRNYIGGIERGERNITILSLIKIAKALKIEVGELFPPIHNLK